MNAGAIWILVDTLVAFARDFGTRIIGNRGSVGLVTKGLTDTARTSVGGATSRRRVLLT